nr:B3 domain-containing protein REM16-like isoform X1 [Ipomoea trifida]
MSNNWSNQMPCKRIKKTWLAKCYHKASSHGLAGSSWKNFALENFIEKDDACVFNLVSQSDSAVIFKVSIFQVVQEVVALNRLAGTTSRKSMQPTNTPYEQLQTGFKCNERVALFNDVNVTDAPNGNILVYIERIVKEEELQPTNWSFGHQHQWKLGSSSNKFNGRRSRADGEWTVAEASVCNRIQNIAMRQYCSQARTKLRVIEAKLLDRAGSQETKSSNASNKDPAYIRAVKDKGKTAACHCVTNKNKRSALRPFTSWRMREQAMSEATVEMAAQMNRRIMKDLKESGGGKRRISVGE